MSRVLQRCGGRGEVYFEGLILPVVLARVVKNWLERRKYIYFVAARISAFALSLWAQLQQTFDAFNGHCWLGGGKKGERKEKGICGHLRIC